MGETPTKMQIKNKTKDRRPKTRDFFVFSPMSSIFSLN